MTKIISLLMLGLALASCASNNPPPTPSSAADINSDAIENRATEDIRGG